MRNKKELVIGCILVTVITTHVTMMIESSLVNMQIRRIIPLGTQHIVFETIKTENCVSKEQYCAFYELNFSVLILSYYLGVCLKDTH